jgi:outer membrane protein assembly factor BamB/uncharacterized protein YuzB (UPF0349 family)
MRELLKLLLVLTLVITGISTNVYADYKGKVYEDFNGNGFYDIGEEVLQGVAVSDGLHVVETDKRGNYCLPGHKGERFLFISTPSGFNAQGAYYRRIEKGKQMYDFALSPYKGRIKKGGFHKFIHITDTEISNTENHEGWVNNIYNYADIEDVAFIVHTGDICYENGLREHIRLMNTENMNCPVFYCIGNHDLVKGEYGEELFENIYGPVYYSFNVGKVHYIVTPMLHGDHKPGYTREDVYRWMKNDLAYVPEGMPIIIFNHDLLTYSDKFVYGINDTDYIDLNQHNLKAWVYGHWHINHMHKQGDVCCITTSPPDKGGIDHSAAAFRIISVDDKGNCRSELRYPYIGKTVRIASIAGNRIPSLPGGRVALSVNAYGSNSKIKEVVYTCYSDNKEIIEKNRMKQQTDWNWYAEPSLSSHLIGKEIIVKVQAMFYDGEMAETEGFFVYRRTRRSAIETEKDWPCLLANPSHIGVLQGAFHLPLSLAWIKNVKANVFMTSPLVYHGNVYVASVDENLQGESHVYGLDAKNGEILWKYKTRNSVKNSIAADAGCVFAQDVEGFLYAVDAITGKLVWEKKLEVNRLPAIVEGLVASDGRVYAGTGKGLCACDIKTGKTLWINKDWAQGEGATTTLSLGENILVSGSQWGALYGNDATDGRLLWSNNEYGLSDRGASAAIHGDSLYIVSRSSFFIINTLTGKILVHKELPVKVDVTSTPLVTENEVVFGTSQSGLMALDRVTLDIKWQFATALSLLYTAPYTRHPCATIETSPVLVGETVFFGASDGVLYAIDKETGKCLWKHPTGSPIFGSVSVSGNGLFAVDFAGNVYGFVSE